MPRPKAKPGAVRSKMVFVRLRAEEEAGLKKLAADLGQPPSRIIRRLQSAYSFGISVTKYEAKEEIMTDISPQLEELAEELIRVQNQIQTVVRTLQAERNESSSAEGKKELTAVEEGQYYAGLREEGYTVSDIVRKVGKSGQFVRDRVALWNSDDMLKEASKDRSRRGGIGLGAAIGIARLNKGNHERQRELVKRAQKSPRERRAVLEELNLYPKRRR